MGGQFPFSSGVKFRYVRVEVQVVRIQDSRLNDDRDWILTPRPRRVKRTCEADS